MKAILSHSKTQTAFEPEAIRVMSQAFDDACNALRILSGDERGREVIATRIVDLASNGVVDAKALCDRVISEAHVSL